MNSDRVPGKGLLEGFGELMGAAGGKIGTLSARLWLAADSFMLLGSNFWVFVTF